VSLTRIARSSCGDEMKVGVSGGGDGIEDEPSLREGKEDRGKEGLSRRGGEE
jgi:hypothetical protein